MRISKTYRRKTPTTWPDRSRFLPEQHDRRLGSRLVLPIPPANVAPTSPPASPAKTETRAKPRVCSPFRAALQRFRDRAWTYDEIWRVATGSTASPPAIVCASVAEAIVHCSNMLDHEHEHERSHSAWLAFAELHGLPTLWAWGRPTELAQATDAHFAGLIPVDYRAAC